MIRRRTGWGTGLAGTLLLLNSCQAPGGIRLAQAAEPSWEAMTLRQADAASGSVALTLYSEGWGLVTDARPVELGAGRQVLRYPGVATQTYAELGYLQVPGEVVRRRFRYDLLNRDQLMRRYDGQHVEITMRGATQSVDAILRMTDNGPVYQVGDRLYTKEPGRVAFPPLPGLASDPSLEWVVERATPWLGVATASYVANQVGWSSTYTLVTDADQQRGDWTHWADILNRAGMEFRNARVSLVAGDVRRGNRPIPLMAPVGGVRAYAEVAAPESYAARYVYHLPGTMTLGKLVEERLALGNTKGVPIERIFRIDSDVPFERVTEPEVPRKARLRLRLANDEAGGMGVPLPAGRVTVYTPGSDGMLAIAGEAQIPDTPRNQALWLDLGEAFDVTAKRTRTAYQVDADGREMSYRLVLKNEMAVPVTLEVNENQSGDWTLLSSSLPGERVSAVLLRFHPVVPAHGQFELTYTLRVRKEPTP